MPATSDKRAMLSGRAVHRRLAVAAQQAAEDFVHPTKAVGRSLRTEAPAGTLSLASDRHSQLNETRVHRVAIEVKAGVGWPKLLDHLVAEHQHCWPQWGIRQEQAGADQLNERRTFSRGEFTDSMNGRLACAPRHHDDGNHHIGGDE